jgi:hypothetical protein
MKETIQTCLRDIETSYHVKILYACESGSRAWGFPSIDSDYDVRFIYLHPMEWYLSIDLESQRDVIEQPINDQIDISGWDLRKALHLLQKGNPPLMEWLGSPTVYLEKSSVADRMRKLVSIYNAPVASSYHYLHMAKGNYRDYLKGSTVWLKKYFYVLRPLLAIRWIEKDLGVVPTEFQVMVEQVIDSPELKAEIKKLLDAKRKGEELDYGPRITPISDFIDRELARLEGMQFEYEHDVHTVPVGELNNLFRSALKEVWQ